MKFCVINDGGIPILTSPSTLRRKFEQLNDPCSSPCEARYARPPSIYHSQHMLRDFTSIGLYLSQYGGQFLLTGIRRRCDDLDKGNGHTLEDDVKRALETKRLENGDNVVVPDAVNHP